MMCARYFKKRRTMEPVKLSHARNHATLERAFSPAPQSAFFRLGSRKEVALSNAAMGSKCSLVQFRHQRPTVDLARRHRIPVCSKKLKRAKVDVRSSTIRSVVVVLLTSIATLGTECPVPSPVNCGDEAFSWSGCSVSCGGTSASLRLREHHANVTYVLVFQMELNQARLSTPRIPSRAAEQLARDLVRCLLALPRVCRRDGPNGLRALSHVLVST